MELINPSSMIFLKGKKQSDSTVYNSSTQPYTYIDRQVLAMQDNALPCIDALGIVHKGTHHSMLIHLYGASKVLVGFGTTG